MLDRPRRRPRECAPARRLGRLGLPRHAAGLDGPAGRRLRWRRAQAPCSAHGAARVGLVLGTSASTIGALGAGLPRTRRAGRASRRALRSERLNTPHALAALRAGGAGPAGPLRHRLHRLFVQRQGLRGRPSAGCAWAWPTPWWWAASTRCATACCSASTRSGLVSPAAVPALRRRAQRHQRRRGRGLALLQRGAGALQLLGYGESNDAHHMSSPHPQGLGAERALDDALARAGVAAARHRLSQPARHRQRAQRRGRGRPGGAALRPAGARQRHQGRHRPHHGRGRHRRSPRSACWRCTSGWRAGSAGTAPVDPALGRAFAQRLRLAPVQQPTRAGGEPLLRLRRQQLRARLRAGGAVRRRAPALCRRRRASGRRPCPAGPRRAPPCATGARRRPTATGARRSPRPPPRPDDCWPPTNAAARPTRCCWRWRWPAPRCADAGHDAAALASVFTSAHGDLPIIDALCTTLAGDPLLLSPTRFHHSVHNAASGYWAIGSGSRARQHGAGGLRPQLCCRAAGSRGRVRRRRRTGAAGGRRHRGRGRPGVGEPQPRPARRWRWCWRRGAAPRSRWALRLAAAAGSRHRRRRCALRPRARWPAMPWPTPCPWPQALAAGSPPRLALPLGPRAAPGAGPADPAAPPPPQQPAAT